MATRSRVTGAAADLLRNRSGGNSTRQSTGQRVRLDSPEGADVVARGTSQSASARGSSPGSAVSQFLTQARQPAAPPRPVSQNAGEGVAVGSNPVLGTFDVNGDGTVNMLDLMALRDEQNFKLMMAKLQSEIGGQVQGGLATAGSALDRAGEQAGAAGAQGIATAQSALDSAGTRAKAFRSGDSADGLENEEVVLNPTGAPLDVIPKDKLGDRLSEFTEGLPGFAEGTQPATGFLAALMDAQAISTAANEAQAAGNQQEADALFGAQDTFIGNVNALVGPAQANTPRGGTTDNMVIDAAVKQAEQQTLQQLQAPTAPTASTTPKPTGQPQVINHPNGNKETINADGSKLFEFADGLTYSIAADGTTTVISPSRPKTPAATGGTAPLPGAAGGSAVPAQGESSVTPDPVDLLNEFLESDPDLILNHVRNSLRDGGASEVFLRWFGNNFQDFWGRYLGYVAEQALAGEVPSLSFVDFVMGFDLTREFFSESAPGRGEQSSRFSSFANQSGGARTI